MIFNRPNNDEANESAQPAATGITGLSAIPALVDTSVIIDGRISDISRAGFAPGKLLIPRFVLAELQNIADSSDAMRRGRGRRGLEMLNDMRQAGVDMDIVEGDYPEIAEVDAKLVRMARDNKCNVLTTDYNLNRVASIEGVRVLNINELANAVRPVILPGEKMLVKVVQPGKERGQGVGYLADGTMIVVDSSDKLIGQEIPVEITRVFQTVAGKMLFAVPVDVKPLGNGRASGPSKLPSQPQARAPRPAQVRSDQRPNPQSANVQADKPSQKPNGNGNGNGRSPKNQGGDDRKPRKRMNPTQRLENSLIEMTQGE
jgi:rRNA-processing protein FCF1